MDSSGICTFQQAGDECNAQVESALEAKQHHALRLVC